MMATNNELDEELIETIEENRAMIKRIAESDLPVAEDCRRMLNHLN